MDIEVQNPLDGTTADNSSMQMGNNSKVYNEMKQGTGKNPKADTFSPPTVTNMEQTITASGSKENVATALSDKTPQIPNSGLNDCHLNTNKLLPSGPSMDFMATRQVLVDEKSKRGKASIQARFEGRLEPLARDFQISNNVTRTRTAAEPQRMRTPPPPKLGSIKLSEDRNVGTGQRRQRSRSPPKRRRRSLSRNQRKKSSPSHSLRHRSDKKFSESHLTENRRPISRDRSRRYEESRYKGKRSTDKNVYRPLELRRSSYSPDRGLDRHTDYGKGEGSRGNKRRRSPEIDKYPDAREFKKRFEQEVLERRQKERDVERQHLEKQDGKRSIEIIDLCSDKTLDRQIELREKRHISPNTRGGENFSSNYEGMQSPSNTTIQQEYPNTSVAKPPCGGDNFSSNYGSMQSPSITTIQQEHPNTSVAKPLHPFKNFPYKPNQQIGNSPINTIITRFPTSAHNMNHTFNQQVIMSSFNTSMTNESMEMPLLPSEMQYNFQANQQLCSIQNGPYQTPNSYYYESNQYQEQQSLLPTPNLQNTPLQMNHMNVCPSTSFTLNNLVQIQNRGQSQRNVCNVTNNMHTDKLNLTGDDLEGISSADDKVKWLRIVSLRIFTNLYNHYAQVQKMCENKAENFKDVFVEAILSRLLTFEDLETSPPSLILIKYNVLYNTDEKNELFIIRMLNKCAEMKKKHAKFGSLIMVEDKLETRKLEDSQSISPATSDDRRASTSRHPTVANESDNCSSKTSNADTKAGMITPSRPNSQGPQISKVSPMPPRFASSKVSQEPKTIKQHPSLETPETSIKQEPRISEVTSVEPTQMKQELSQVVPTASIKQEPHTSEVTPVATTQIKQEPSQVVPTASIKQEPHISEVTPVATTQIKQEPNAIKQQPSQVAPTASIKQEPQTSVVTPVATTQMKTPKVTPVPVVRQQLQTSKKTPVMPLPMKQIKVMPIQAQPIKQEPHISKWIPVPAVKQQPQTSKITPVMPLLMKQIKVMLIQTQPIKQGPHTSKLSPLPTQPIRQVAQSSKVTPMPAKSNVQVQKTPEETRGVANLASPSILNPKLYVLNEDSEEITANRLSVNISAYKMALNLVNIVLCKRNGKLKHPVIDEFVHSKIAQMADTMHSTFHTIINESFEAVIADKNLPVVKIKLDKKFCNYSELKNFMNKYKVLKGTFVKEQGALYYYATLPDEQQFKAMFSQGQAHYMGKHRLILTRWYGTYEGAENTTVVTFPRENPKAALPQIPGAPCQVTPSDCSETKFIESQISKLDSY